MGDVRHAGLLPGLGRAPGGQNGTPCQYSFLENPWTEEPDSKRVSTELAHMHVPIIKQPHQVKSNDITLVIISMVHVQRNTQ